MAVDDYVLVRGIQDTRSTFEAWRREPMQALTWVFLGSLGVALALLAGVWIVASVSTPDPTPVSIAGVDHPVGFGDLLHALYRNSLVLALHATACVAGFIAGSSIPLSASQRRGVSRWVHEKAGKLAIGFVVGVTAFSLTTQVYVLGSAGATLAAQLRLTPGELVFTVLPHAIPELVAIFLPLSAWILLSRRGEWNRMLAATFVTVAIAVPMLIAAALIEAYVWPDILRSVAPGLS
jgi:stage II sporulation SpoM-like protein